jgi:hypothetical protein
METMEYLITLTAAGSAGSATVTGYTETAVRGFLEYVGLDYSIAPAAPATTVVTLTEELTGRPVFSLTGNTNGAYYVRAQASNVWGVGVSGSWPRLFFNGRRLKAVVTGADPDAIVTLRIQVSGELNE